MSSGVQRSCVDNKTGLTISYSLKFLLWGTIITTIGYGYHTLLLFCISSTCNFSNDFKDENKL